MTSFGDEHLTMPNCDGTSLPAILPRSRSPQPRATVVMSHGLFNEKDEHGRYARLSSLLNGIGLATVRCDFRGHGEQGAPLCDATVSGMVLDLQAASRRARRAYTGIDCWWVASIFGGAVSTLSLQMRHALGPARMALLNLALDFRATFSKPHSPVAAELFKPARWDLAWQTGRLEVDRRAHARSGIFSGPLAALADLSLLYPKLALECSLPPTRIVHGTADLMVPHDLTRNLSALSPSINFRSVDGAGRSSTEPTHEVAAFTLVADRFSVGSPPCPPVAGGNARSRESELR